MASPWANHDSIWVGRLLHECGHIGMVTFIDTRGGGFGGGSCGACHVGNLYHLQAMMKDGWIGVDLDGTLAVYDHWRGADHIGAPIPAMVAVVKSWLQQGYEVRIMTARACQAGKELHQSHEAINKFCLEQFGFILPITYSKDFGMIALYDDRAVSVEPNTGRILTSWEPSPNADLPPIDGGKS